MPQGKTTRRYRKVSCHTSKAAANAAKKKLHTAGQTGTVRKSGSGFCVFSAGKRKRTTIKKTGQTLSGRKRTTRRKKAA